MLLIVLKINIWLQNDQYLKHKNLYEISLYTGRSLFSAKTGPVHAFPKILQRNFFCVVADTCNLNEFAIDLNFGLKAVRKLTNQVIRKHTIISYTPKISSEIPHNRTKIPCMLSCIFHKLFALWHPCTVG